MAKKKTPPPKTNLAQVTASNSQSEAPPQENTKNSESSGNAAALPGFPVVGIGASAGGLEAIDELLQNLPVDTGMAFVVVTHQHPGHTSLLPELLARETRMVVVEAADGTKLEPNHVYVGTPGGNLAILNGTLHRMETGNRVSPNLPIDYFFRSLAKDQKEQAICIVLSGTGTDGTLGLKAIKGEMGMAMVQQPQSAKYAGMPSSAEETGMADYVLTPTEMPKQLMAYASGPYLDSARVQHGKRNTAQAIAVPEESIQKIFLLLRDHTGNDFSGYKANTIRRRIERRMNVHQIRSAKDYIRYLQENSHEIDVLFKELLISVTSFFRDPLSWEAFAAGPLVDLINSRPENHTFRAWVPGCATGEEVYTLAIVVRECLDKMNRHMDVQIFGTDLDQDAVDAARVGTFPNGISVDVSPDRLERYFTREESTFRIRKEIREMAIFAPQNVVKDPPFTKLDFLSCRNVLIYLNPELQKRLLPIFHYALRPDGLLMLGPSETIGNSTELFDTVDKKWKIYRRKELLTASYSLPVIPASIIPAASKSVDSTAISSQVQDSNISAMLEKMALNLYCPTFVVINERGDLLHIHGRTGEYLELAEGQIRTNILDMAKEGLAHELASVLRQASSTEDEIVRDNVRVKSNDHVTFVTLTAKRVQQPEPISGLLMISFRPATSHLTSDGADPLPNREDESRADHTDSLERELKFMRDTHQRTLEELETSNEELKSTNEELQSTNEEMQSTNEELETSKEEMQSLNEELTTVNAELLSKVTDLSQANDDMQNLLNSTDIATIFLDDDLNIKRYTEQVTKIIGLRPTDIGRPISELTLKIKSPHFVQDCNNVLNTLEFKKKRVETFDGDWYLMRILPYRTVDKVIDGLVLTFVNIKDLKEAEKSGEMRAYFEAIFDTVEQPLLVIDAHFIVVSANRSFYETFRLRPKQVMEKLLFEFDDGSWNHPELRDLMEDVLAENYRLEDYILEQEFSKLGKKKLRLKVRSLDSSLSFPGRILVAIQDLAI